MTSDAGTSTAPGIAFSILVLSVLLATAVAWVVAALYRRRMVALMRGGPAPDAQAPHTAEVAGMPARRQNALPDLALNRRAAMRLLTALSLLSLLVGLTQSWFALHYVYETERTFSAKQWLVLGLVYSWPMTLGWSLLLRWSWPRMLAAVAGYFAVITPIGLLASNEAQTLGDLLTLYGIVALIPVATMLLVGASGRVRAVAPYLLPMFALLMLASHLGLEMLGRETAQSIHVWSGWLKTLVGGIGAYSTMALFALGPWLLAAWPMLALARSLAQAYRRKRFSDLGYLFTAYWLLVIAANAITSLAGVGVAGLAQLLAWLWLPLGLTALRGWLAPTTSPATLLVLRVFQRDAQVEALFDRVVERWRLTGNTLLIAGTDLISRTLDPDDLFTFLGGRLAGRFITSTDEIPRRMAELDLRPDPDGRFRVNEYYCYDSTWQPALRALVNSSDIVLMDLRGFKPENQGCRFELRVLAAAPHLRRVVLLHDAATARSAAEAELANAPADRFVWIEAGRLDGAKTHEVLAALFETRSAK